MSLHFFEGPAGSGKTTRLVTEMRSVLRERPLREGQAVLALTKMHGSRRRLLRRLAVVPELRRNFACVTLDSFAWRLLQRWRALARHRFGDRPPRDYAEVCLRAGGLLALDFVAGWVAARYPVALVDELQDNKGGEIAVVQGLASTSVCLAAGDDFQDLSPDGGTNLAVSWARTFGTVVRLTTIHRTNVAGLLLAGSALRSGEALAGGKGFTLLGARNSSVGASFLAKNLTWWTRTGDIAVLTPAATAPFVAEIMDRVAEKPIGDEGYGPFTVRWESTVENDQRAYLANLNLPEDSSEVVSVDDLRLSDDLGTTVALRQWFERQRRISGRTSFTAGHVREQVLAVHQRLRAFRRAEDRGVRAMTVHQAKNREFESVIVLWPYKIPSGIERQRRLLYNAVTRAKRQALVIVQNPQRLTEPPFTAA